MASPRAALTYEDFLTIPEDHSRRHEILDGELVVSPMPLTLRSSDPTVDRRRKFDLYARYDVPCYWLIEPDERVIDACELAGGVYRLARRASGDDPVTLPPFGALAFAPAVLWRP